MRREVTMAIGVCIASAAPSELKTPVTIPLTLPSALFRSSSKIRCWKTRSVSRAGRKALNSPQAAFHGCPVSLY